jgi:hypothetical protein
VAIHHVKVRPSFNIDDGGYGGMTRTPTIRGNESMEERNEKRILITEANNDDDGDAAVEIGAGDIIIGVPGIGLGIGGDVGDDDTDTDGGDTCFEGSGAEEEDEVSSPPNNSLIPSNHDVTISACSASRSNATPLAVTIVKQ